VDRHLFPSVYLGKEHLGPTLLIAIWPTERSKAAARAAGFSESFSKVAAYRLGKIPAVARAIEAIREAGLERAVYGLAEAMQEADEAETGYWKS
jgi:hypothetical protein